MEVLPATPGHFEEIYPLLLDFGAAHMTREDWRRMIFDLPWPVEEPHRGYMLRDGGAVVGFLGTIFSSRMIGGRRRRFCATSSWIVRESHRSASLQLVRPLLELTSHTILNPAPSPTAFEIFRRLGLRPLDDTQILVPPFARLDQATRWIGDRVTTDLGAMRSELDAGGRAIVDHMAGTRAAQAMLRSGRRRCHIVATRSPWKGPLRLAHVVYASDWELLWLDPGLA